MTQPQQKPQHTIGRNYINSNGAKSHWRMGYIGGSDAVKIMQGNWHELWLEKTGKTQPKDLSDIFRVQLGVATEAFNIKWFEQQYEKQCAYQVEAMKDYEGLSLKGTLDGVVLNETGGLSNVGVECKHVNSFKSFQDQVLYYTPQLQLYMFVADLEAMYFSVIQGNEWTCSKISRNEAEIHRMIPILKDFWKLVISGKEPVANIPDRTLKVVDSIAIDDLIARDASKENHFTELAEKFISSKVEHDNHNKVKAELKGMLADNEREVFNNSLSIKRTKSGVRFNIR